jgi:hypothetical protein
VPNIHVIIGGAAESPFTPGVWTDISPSEPDIADTFGTNWVAMDPSNLGTLYTNVDQQGIWKTTDFGTTWNRLGTPGTYDFSGETDYIDNAIRVLVDPNDPDHLIATQGVAGSTLGFWVSTDGGANWHIPAGFDDIVSTTTNDVTTMVVDPTDFDHVLLGSHSPWAGSVVAGILETTDGGLTFTAHAAPGSWPAGSHGIAFLYDPATEQGNSDTWLVTTDSDGFWRTTNGGSSWTQVASGTGYQAVHHGADFHYDSNGRLWTGAQPYPVYSDDNGATWSQATSGLTSATYYSVMPDGDNLHTQVANTGTNATGSSLPFMTTSEASPGTWSAYQSGAQTFVDGPFNMVYDSVSDLIYAAMWKSGIHVLKPIR